MAVATDETQVFDPPQSAQAINPLVHADAGFRPYAA
jgi:hypothetical protein